MITLYDATLREGAQSAETAFTLADKLDIVMLLNELSVPYIEAGNPGSNPKDALFYREAAKLSLANSRLVAFGPTCRVGANAENDEGILALLKAETPAVCIFGKSWDFHVKHVLRAENGDNLRIIADTISRLRRAGREVIFDAEHFFDGYKNNAAYAMETLRAAKDAGANWLCLCDTNGGCFPHEITAIVSAVAAEFGETVGVHCHNDTGMAQANTVCGVLAGAKMAQAMLGGIGERCGGAELCAVAANLQLKLGLECLPKGSITRLRQTSEQFYALVNQSPNPAAPYVGRNAFAHKGGMHIDAVLKEPRSFEHISPEAVGGERRFLLSEMAGRAAVFEKALRAAPDLCRDGEVTAALLARLKELELAGYQFEGAEASFGLEVLRHLNRVPQFFSITGFKVMVHEPALDGQIASAIVQLKVGGEDEITAAVGNGPVNALDRALRKALERFYPQLGEITLTDYKVRVLDSSDTTAATVRVVIESTNGKRRWSTVGVSADIIDASWHALIDSILYALITIN